MARRGKIKGVYMFCLSIRYAGYLGIYNIVSAYIPVARKLSLYRELGEYAFDESATYGTRGIAESLPVDKELAEDSTAGRKKVRERWQREKT